MLQSFGDDIWLADGPIAGVAGFDYPTRMAIIRLSGGALFIWSTCRGCARATARATSSPGWRIRGRTPGIGASRHPPALGRTDEL